MSKRDIYSEPKNVDVHTLANLGPLRPLAGVWQGSRGLDIKPKAGGPKQQAYVERIELQPIDPQTNGPQLLYGLRYHTHITRPDSIKTYHEQVAMASGTAAADAKSFELVAKEGLTTYGICSSTFLHEAFRTTEFRIKVKVNDDGTWEYEEDTVLQIEGQAEPFHHVDRNHLTTQLAKPTPNPLARPQDP